MVTQSPTAPTGRAASFVERPALALPGWPMLFAMIATTIVLIVGLILTGSSSAEPGPGFFVLLLVTMLHFILYGGFTVVAPNDARALVLFGKYAGSLKTQGFWWVNPFSAPRRRISLRTRNFESARLKVNEHDGNPIEIAAVVVWRVIDSAEALFQIDDYEQFLKVQTEAAIRTVATSYPYDAHDDGTVSLRGNPHEIGDILRVEIQGRLNQAGIEVTDARLSHLAYAPEIANAMLRRQQANAVIAARTRIVEGAVGMVEMALDELSKKQVVQLDEERKATMVSNLLVVLCSEHETQPVVNAGTLYQ